MDWKISTTFSTTLSERVSPYWRASHGGLILKGFDIFWRQGQRHSMDTNASDSIETQVSQLRQKALSAFQRQLRGIHSTVDHPQYISETVVREAARAAEANARQLLADAMSQISTMPVTLQAFVMVDDAIALHLSDLEHAVQQGRGFPLSHSLLSVAGDLIREVRQRLERQLDGYRDIFTQRSAKPTKSNAGRKRTYDWDKASDEILNKIHRGQLTPKNQAEIEVELIEYLAEGDKEPGESTVRPYAKLIWDQVKREA